MNYKLYNSSSVKIKFDIIILSETWLGSNNARDIVNEIDGDLVIDIMCSKSNETRRLLYY